jgi:glutathione S-transferase
MAILHGVNLSPFVRKVRFALAEKGITVDQEQVVPFGLSEEFLKLSPLGKIPVYQDGDLVLPDSSVIIDYLENTQPEPSLYPSDPGERGRALFYEEYGDTKVTSALSTVFFQRFVRKNFFNEEADEAVVAQALSEEIPSVLDFIEAELADNDYLVGNRFSIADIGITTAFVNFRIAGESVDAGRWPKVAAYVDRVFSRPALKAIVEGDIPG